MHLKRGSCAWHGPTPEGAYAGKSLDEARKVKALIVQWLPPEHTIPCILHKPDGYLMGYCEQMVSLDVGKVVQFERIGFSGSRRRTRCSSRRTGGTGERTSRVRIPPLAL